MSLLEMSAAGAVIILAAALLRTLGKNRLPVWAFETLWALAWARLVLPVRLPFRFSAWALLRRLVPQTAGPGSAPADVILPGQAAPEAVDIIHNIPAISGIGTPFPTLTVLWLVGAAVCALVLVLRYVRACRRFREAETIDCNYVNHFLAEHPLRRRVSVQVSGRIGAPLTYGVLRPVILLPRSMDREDTATLRYVLVHELAHIRRFDAARKLLLAVAVCLHWFDPLVWALYVLAGRDMELACDQAVLRTLGPDSRKDYARALLSMEERRAGSMAAASGFAKNPIEERIHSIMRIKKRSFLSTILALALVLSVGAVLATAAPEDTAAGTVDAAFSGDVVSSSDGTVYVFTADGEPVTMTQQEYTALIDSAEVEWWTAEEYADWLEQEKKDLQDCLGQRAWTNTDGWFTWTQEKIDEAIGMYEQVLKEIQSGLLVSKPLADGGTLYEGTDTAVQFSSGDTDGEQTERLEQWEEVLAPYTPFGVTYEYDKETDDVQLFWNGERIRGIYDNTAGVWMTEHAGNGTWPADTPELVAVYTDGVLTGLRKAAPAEQQVWTDLRQDSAG